MISEDVSGVYRRLASNERRSSEYYRMLGGGGGGVRVYCGTIKMIQSIRENVNR